MTRYVEDSGLYLEMIASQLRSQIVTLSNVLETIERTHQCDDEYIEQSLRSVAIELGRLRKTIHQ